MTLNPAQTRILIASAVLFIAMGLFPPWSYTVEANSIRSEKPAGYALIFDPPEVERDTPAYGVRLDVARLLLQWIILAAATGCVVLVAKRPRVSELEKRTNKGRQDSDQSVGISHGEWMSNRPKGVRVIDARIPANRHETPQTNPDVYKPLRESATGGTDQRPAISSKMCPSCKLTNPHSAQYCDCGYNFHTGSIEANHPGAALSPKKFGKGRLLHGVDASASIVAFGLSRVFGVGGALPIVAFGAICIFLSSLVTTRISKSSLPTATKIAIYAGLMAGYFILCVVFFALAAAIHGK